VLPRALPLFLFLGGRTPRSMGLFPAGHGLVVVFENVTFVAAQVAVLLLRYLVCVYPSTIRFCDSPT